MKRLFLGLLILILSLVEVGYWGGHDAWADPILAKSLPVLGVSQPDQAAIETKLRTGFERKVDLNNSNIRAFEKYPGFYPNLARLVIQNSPYEKVEDVLNIPGLTNSQKELLQQNLANFIVTEPDPALIEGGDRYNPGIYR